MNKKIKNSKILFDFLNNNSEKKNLENNNKMKSENKLINKVVGIFRKRYSENLEDIEFDNKINHFEPIIKNIEKLIKNTFTNLEILKNDLEHLKKINKYYYDYSKENIKEIEKISKIFSDFRKKTKFNKLYNNYNKIFAGLYKKDNYSKLVSDYNNYLFEIILLYIQNINEQKENLVFAKKEINLEINNEINFVKKLNLNPKEETIKYFEKKYLKIIQQNYLSLKHLEKIIVTIKNIISKNIFNSI